MTDKDETDGNGPDAEERRRRRAAGAKGGKARAARLSPAERSEGARMGARARWGTPPRATHVGELRIGDMTLPCAVLDDGTRVLSGRGMADALGRARGGKQSSGENPDGVLLPEFLAPIAIKPFISETLLMAILQPVQYRSDRGGRPANGIRAELIPEICRVWLRARAAGALKHEALLTTAARAEVLMCGLATVGIIALVDEATGFQDDRERAALAKVLKEYVNEEMRPWVQTFPHEFFKHVYRIHGWKYVEGSTRGPRYAGKLIDKYIYERMPPGVLEELRAKNPATNGRRKHHHHRHLTDQIGIPQLDRQILAVTTLLSVSDDRATFERYLKKAFPKTGDQGDLPIPREDPEPEQDDEPAASPNPNA